MKKIIKWGALAVVVLIVGVLAIVYFKLGAIIKYAVETQGSQQMNLKTELDSASVGIFGGEVGMDDLKIANPPGFTNDKLFSLDGLKVKAPLGQLRGNPKRISTITLDKPRLLIERSSDGKFNFKAAIENMPKTPSGPSEPREPKEPPPPGEEMKLIIDELTVKDAMVVVRPGIDFPGIAKEISVPVPTVVMKNIGNAENAQNGAAMRDVAQQVITVLAANASNSSALPEQLRGLLNLDVKALTAELGKRLGAEAQKRIAAAVPGELGQQLGAVLADPNALMKDPSKAVDVVKGNIGKALEERGLPATLPTNVDDIKKDPGKAVEGLKGLLGGDKKDKKRKEPKE